LSERPEIWEAYAAFLRRSPELILEWSDPESEARGWLVLNSLRGGAAGGGTRMRPGLTRDEVIFLAKVMECKFSISGPPIGGAKSGIDFDPLDPRKREVLSRWFRAIEPLLAARYGTGGDLNVDVREVVAHCKELGLGHPQEGVVRGHLGLRGADLERRLDTMRDGLATLVEGGIGVEGKHYRVVDLVTGYGVAVATRHLLELQGRSIEGARILVEGFGCVGGSAALYLSRWGASLLGIVDLRSGVVNESGIPQEEVERLLRRSIGVHSIISGSNHPFWASEPGDTQLEEIADDEFAIGADFIANSGVASAFASLMLSEETMTADAIFDRVRETIVQALEEAAVRAGGVQRGLLAGGIQLVLERSGVMGPMVRADVGT
jgi:hypothetical protein